MTAHPKRARSIELANSQFVTLGADGEIFALPVERVQEILDVQPIFRLPHAPPYLVGMVDVRGRTVPVIDLRGRLGLPLAAATEHTRIVVLEASIGERELMVGLMADRVFEVTSLDGQGLETPPEIGVRWKSQYIAGVGRRGEQFVIVLDLPHLLSSEELPLLETSNP